MAPQDLSHILRSLTEIQEEDREFLLCQFEALTGDQKLRAIYERLVVLSYDLAALKQALSLMCPAVPSDIERNEL